MACHNIIKNGSVSTKAHLITQLFYQSPQVLFAIREQMEEEFVLVYRLSSVWSSRGTLPIRWPARLGGGWGERVIARLYLFGRRSRLRGTGPGAIPARGPGPS